MDLDIDFTEIVQKEITFNNLQTLNCNISLKENLIMYVNIRGLNANFTKLEVYIESLKVKPILIVCAETRVLGDNFKKDYNLNKYNIYYNKSTEMDEGTVIANSSEGNKEEMDSGGDGRSDRELRFNDGDNVAYELPQIASKECSQRMENETETKAPPQTTVVKVQGNTADAATSYFTNPTDDSANKSTGEGNGSKEEGHGQIINPLYNFNTENKIICEVMKEVRNETESSPTKRNVWSKS